MHHLTTRVRLNLEEDGEGDLFPHIDWDVQGNPDCEMQMSMTSASKFTFRRNRGLWVGATCRVH